MANDGDETSMETFIRELLEQSGPSGSGSHNHSNAHQQPQLEAGDKPGDGEDDDSVQLLETISPSVTDSILAKIRLQEVVAEKRGKNNGDPSSTPGEIKIEQLERDEPQSSAASTTTKQPARNWRASLSMEELGYRYVARLASYGALEKVVEERGMRTGNHANPAILYYKCRKYKPLSCAYMMRANAVASVNPEDLAEPRQYDLYEKERHSHAPLNATPNAAAVESRPLITLDSVQEMKKYCKQRHMKIVTSGSFRTYWRCKLAADCPYMMVAKKFGDGHVEVSEKAQHNNHDELEPMDVDEVDEGREPADQGRLIATLGSRDEMKEYRLRMGMRYKHGNGQSFYYSCRQLRNGDCPYMLVGKRCRLNSGQIFVFARNEHNHEEVVPVDGWAMGGGASGGGASNREDDSYQHHSEYIDSTAMTAYLRSEMMSVSYTDRLRSTVYYRCYHRFKPAKCPCVIRVRQAVGADGSVVYRVALKGGSHTHSMSDRPLPHGGSRDSADCRPLTTVGSPLELTELSLRHRMKRTMQSSKRVYLTCVTPDCPYTWVGKKKPGGSVDLLEKGEHNHPTEPANNTLVGGRAAFADPSLRLLTTIANKMQLHRLKFKLNMKTRAAYRGGSTLQCAAADDCPYRLVCKIINKAGKMLIYEKAEHNHAQTGDLSTADLVNSHSLRYSLLIKLASLDAFKLFQQEHGMKQISSHTKRAYLCCEQKKCLYAWSLKKFPASGEVWVHARGEHNHPSAHGPVSGEGGGQYETGCMYTGAVTSSLFDEPCSSRMVGTPLSNVSLPAIGGQSQSNQPSSSSYRPQSVLGADGMEDIKAVHVLCHDPPLAQGSVNQPLADFMAAVHSQPGATATATPAHMNDIPDVTAMMADAGGGGIAMPDRQSSATPSGVGVVASFQLEERMVELKSMAEGMGLKTSENGNSLMFLCDGPTYKGKWLVVEDKGGAISLLEFENMRPAREEEWQKADWRQLRRAIKCALMEFFEKK